MPGMPSKVNFLGHAVHPMLVAFPIGLLTMVPVFDIARFATHDPMFGDVSFWMLTCGAAGALLAALPGLVDFLGIPGGTRAQRVALTHLVVNLTAALLFIASWLIRLTVGIPVIGVAAFVVGLAGLCALAVGGWLGGELVERHGLTVSPQANLDASSSLTPTPTPFGPRPTSPQPV